MILSTEHNVAALKGLTEAERLEAVVRLVENGTIEYLDGADALRLSGCCEDDLELVEVAARARLQDLREFYGK